MRFARFHVIALVLIGGLAQAYAETPSEYRHRIAKADADMNLEEHSINMARKDKKLTREQAIEQMKAVIDKNKEAHKQL